jgi:VIT1/CCC1 family predicted Fe2+/Mn2+ transporter
MLKPRESSPENVRRWQANLLAEWDAAALYRALAATERNADKAAVFLRLAEVEDHHATRWERYLRESGAPVPTKRRSPRGRILQWLAERFGVQSVLPSVMSGELADMTMYDDQPDAGNLSQQERGHARVFSAMSRGESGATIASRESWHRRDAGGGLRAAVFGVNDGLVSNLSLVFGVAGAAPEMRFILLAGLAGLLAGAFSMAAGEFISISSQRDLFERQIALEREELETAPEEEAEELALIYEAKGIPRADAQRVARRLIGQGEAALDTLAREELGLDREALGSPWQAAGASAVSFAAGAFMPVLPYLFGMSRSATLGISAVLSALALILVGLGISLVTGRGALFSAGRILLVGAIAAGVTVGLGRLIGSVTT